MEPLDPLSLLLLMLAETLPPLQLSHLKPLARTKLAPMEQIYLDQESAELAIQAELLHMESLDLQELLE